MRYLVITDIHGNLEALDAVPGRRRRATANSCWCSAISSATAREPNAVIDRVLRAQAGRDDPGQPRQGRLRPRARRATSSRSPAAPRSGRGETLTPENRDWLAEAAAGTGGRSTTPWRSATARRSTRIAYMFDASTRVRALERGDAAALPVRPHAPARSSFELPTANVRRLRS